MKDFQNRTALCSDVKKYREQIDAARKGDVEAAKKLCDEFGLFYALIDPEKIAEEADGLLSRWSSLMSSNARRIEYIAKRFQELKDEAYVDSFIIDEARNPGSANDASTSTTPASAERIMNALDVVESILRMI